MSQYWQGSFKGAGGAELFYQAERPEAYKAAVALVHGFGDHSGGLANLADPLETQGYACYRLDLRGHGRSPGSRGHVGDWSEFRGDLVAFLQLVTELEPGRPTFLLGHGLGGLISLEAVLRRPADLPELAGLISIAPAICVAAPPLVLGLLRVLAVFRPHQTISTKPAYYRLTRDPRVVSQMKADKLRLGQMTLALAREALQAQSFVRERAGALSLPWLLVLGTADSITPPGPLRRFFEAAGSREKQFRAYEGALHRPFDDPSREQVIADLVDWMDTRLIHRTEEVFV